MSEDIKSTNPFGRIALSLSGGGVRAVGFHLGTLDYLNHVDMLTKVHTISSVSGGSLVAIGYALTLKQEHSFEQFYDDICEYLPELNTIEALLENLRERKPQVASGSRTLITSLAQVYQEKYFTRYFKDPKFGDFWEEEPKIHLKEMIFNATEFKTGFAFRFQKSDYDCLIGNGKIWLDPKYARSIRMADIMAASSCIPGGMEPMMFPQDFHWPGDKWRTRGRSERFICDSIEKDLEKNFGTNTIPLMDGGVYDNQGITSVMLALARRHRGQSPDIDDDRNDMLSGMEPSRPVNHAHWFLHTMESASDVEKQKDMGNLDLFIVSDTPTRKDPMYKTEPSGYKKRNGFVGFIRSLNLGKLSTIGWVTTVILTISFWLSLQRFKSDLQTYNAGESLEKLAWNIESIWYVLSTSLTLMVPAILAIATVVILVGLRILGTKMVEDAIETMPPTRRSLWYYAKKLRLGMLWEMLTLRAGSLSALASRIYMNRIRQLGYTLLYSHEEFEKRVMDNDINTLVVRREDDVPDDIDLSEAVDKVIKRATTMRTKMWIDKPKGHRDDLEVMIATGQITTCYNIIKYLWSHKRDENGELSEEFRALFDLAMTDWKKFNEDPFLFVDERSKAGRDRGVFWNRPGAYKVKRWYRANRKRKVIKPKHTKQ